MSRQELIEKALKGMETLSNEELNEMNNFLEFILSKHEKKALSRDVSGINTSSKSYKFLEEDSDLYTVNDLKVKYGK